MLNNVKGFKSIEKTTGNKMHIWKSTRNLPESMDIKRALE